jgi:hypothetical protein
MKFVILIFSLLSSGLFADEGIIGNPLSSFRSQTGETCWAHSTAHMLESIVQKESAASLSIKLDTNFWFHIFRNRLRQRWIKNSPFVDSLNDKNFFNEMGFPEEALSVFMKKGLNFSSKMMTDINEFNPKVQLFVSSSKDKINDYKNLNFKNFKPVFEIQDKDVAFSLIDQLLIKMGFSANTNPDYNSDLNQIMLQNGQVLNLINLQTIDEFVWVAINNNSLNKSIDFFYNLTEFGFKILNRPISKDESIELIKKSLRKNIPVPINFNGHSVLILAADSNFFYVADSQSTKIDKIKIQSLKYTVAHFVKSFLDDELSIL